MRSLIIILVLLLSQLHSAAQEASPPRSIALRADLLQHGVALPSLTRSFTPFAPGVRLGVVRHGRSSERTEWRQQAFVGWYRHPQLHDAFMLSGEIAFRLKLGNAFLGLSGGPGYMLQLPYAPVYEYRDGQYERCTQLLHRATVQFAAEGGMRFAEKWEVLLRFEELIEYPYGLNGSSILPHRILSLGVAMDLPNN